MQDQSLSEILPNSLLAQTKINHGCSEHLVSPVAVLPSLQGK